MAGEAILIIEDNPSSRKMLRLSLEKEHYAVAEAEDGASALEKASLQNFDLIIQDLVLPDIDGFILNQKLRELPGAKEIPIFVLSGFLTGLDKQAQYPGVTVFLLKPIEPSYLLDVVKSHLPIAIPSTILIGKGKHILIADDNPIQLKLFSTQLRNAGFEVTTALDGAIALQTVIDRPPDVIISDILMPKMDGFSLCAEIKRNPKLCHIPVMLLTSNYLETEDLLLAKKIGASCYLTRTPDGGALISELLKIFDTKLSVPDDAPFELTEDIKERHIMRSIHQLEQQVLANANLAKRCSMLIAQLSLIDVIANALTTSSKGIEESLKEVLYFCLDTTGISKGVLYLRKSDNNMILSQQIGYNEDENEKIASFFGAPELLSEIIEKNQSFAIPSKHFYGQPAENFLTQARVKFAFVIPMFSGVECLGLLFLGSDQINLSNEETKEFMRTLGAQFGQSIALASAFDKLLVSEHRYRQLVEISPDAICIKQDDKFVYMNSAALKLLNAHSLEELNAQPLYDVFMSDYKKVIEEYIKNNQYQIFTPMLEGKIVTLKKDILDVEIVISPFVYAGKPASYIIMRDITDRKRSVLHLEVQYAIAWILAESASLFVAMGKILKIICERLQWDCAAIWAVDEQTNILRCTRVWQIPQIHNNTFLQEIQNMQLASGAGLAGQVWEERKAIWRLDITNDEAFLQKHSVIETGLRTAVAFPIIYENKVLGVIEFFSKKTLSPDHALLLWFESIGNQFGLFLIRKHMEKQLLYLAEHDVLTGLPNRGLLEQYLNTAIITAKESAQKIAILSLDLDHFKYINDSVGQQAGDLLLKEISENFLRCLRPQDSISRLGGDEFIIILPNIHQKEEVIEIIARLQNQLATLTTVKGKTLFMTTSVGISLYPDDGSTVQGLIKSADIAMYAAKEKGRNDFLFCTYEMTEKAEKRGILQNSLRQALENNEFLLYYQPKIEIATQRIIGMEALIRWKKSDVILLPGSFIAEAEDSDLIIPIGEWVLKTAFEQNKIWQSAGLPTLTMSVNLSVRNLNKNLLQVMEQVLTEINLLPGSFEIELTESALMENVENNVQILRNLKEMGLKISIDDFGTGYSSLSYLKRFPIDIIKIDQSFVRDIATDQDDAAIVTAIIAMAHSLSFKVIAEGVETEAQLKFLCEHGCDDIQGYYFSRPLPAAEATNFIKNSKISWNFD